jgi:hypothetical protein
MGALIAGLTSPRLRGSKSSENYFDLHEVKALWGNESIADIRRKFGTQ